MTVEELRVLYHQRVLVEAMVEPSLESEGWVVEFRHASGGIVALTDTEGVECCFDDIDMATENALDVGFHQVRIADSA